VQRLIAGIRARLVAWNILIIGLILALACASVYAAQSRSIQDQVDNRLLGASEQAGPILFPRIGFGNGDGPGPPGGRRPTEGYNGGVFFVALGPDAAVRANPQQVTLSTLPWPDSPQPTFATIQLPDGGDARLLLRRMPDGGMLVTGQSLDSEEKALHSLLLVLIVGGGLGLVLSLGAAWFLSGRA
jgi:hypothetical protein